MGKKEKIQLLFTMCQNNIKSSKGEIFIYSVSNSYSFSLILMHPLPDSRNDILNKPFLLLLLKHQSQSCHSFIYVPLSSLWTKFINHYCYENIHVYYLVVINGTVLTVTVTGVLFYGHCIMQKEFKSILSFRKDGMYK